MSANKNQRIELLVMAIVAVAAFFLWDTYLVYPIKLFAVLMHEISHGIAAVLTGGRIEYLQLYPNLGGKCVTQGGVPFLIASAGYLGSLIWGLIIFYSTKNNKLNLWTTTVIAIIIVIITANAMRGFYTILFALIISATLIVSPRLFNKVVNAYIMKILGLITAFYVLIDIKEDVIDSTSYLSDASLFSQLTGIPAFMVGVFWFLVAVLALFFTLKRYYKYA